VDGRRKQAQRMSPRIFGNHLDNSRGKHQHIGSLSQLVGSCALE
jgi:hypothetical protein